MSYILSIINQKGGSGKTTTSVNLSVALKDLSLKILVIDLDPQASLTFSFGINNSKNIFNFLENINDEFEKSEDLSIIPSNQDLADFELDLVNMPNREFIIKSFLDQVKTSFDLIVIDCPPSLSLFTINALTASDGLLIPCVYDVLSVHGLTQLSNTVNKVKMGLNPDLKILGVLPVMFDSRKKLTTEIDQYIRKELKLHVFDTKIRLDVKLTEAPSFGKSAIEYSPNSKGSVDYKKLATIIYQKINTQFLITKP
ncbi:MAG: ParA family protein [Cytophagales bacterium]